MLVDSRLEISSDLLTAILNTDQRQEAGRKKRGRKKIRRANVPSRVGDLDQKYRGFFRIEFFLPSFFLSAFLQIANCWSPISNFQSPIHRFCNSANQFTITCICVGTTSRSPFIITMRCPSGETSYVGNNVPALKPDSPVNTGCGGDA